MQKSSVEKSARITLQVGGSDGRQFHQLLVQLRRPKDPPVPENAAQLLPDETPIHEMDELQGLIAEAHDRGFLTIEEITTCLEEVEVTKEQIVELHAHLVDQGIDILDAKGKPIGASSPSRPSPPST
jgi:hypothetical protein